MNEINQVLADRYQLNAQIGAGGSARVFSATDLRLGRDVAVKILDASAINSADPKALRRFERGAVALATF
ncbi:MAG TPA: hypothetical protein PKV27_09380, partial [Ilumatobacteraceae bacterium]|nr:hypothetical protein [Ilumatobacteraceae bacterium]